MASLAKDLISLIGPERISVSAADITTHSTDKWFASNPPQVVVHAQSTEDVSKVLAYAHQHRIPVTPQGSRVGYVGGCVPLKGGIALSVAGMNRILEINTADGVAVVEPGVITGELQAQVRKLGWFYPPDPASLKECSLGGNIATNAGGPRCLKYGVTRHYVLGLEVVLADGRVTRLGRSTIKGVAGYDLAGLVVIDFIDMDESKNNRAVEKMVKDCLKEDRARVQMGKISSFGLMEISRQRRRTGVLEGTTHVCEHCAGTGRVRSVESSALAALRTGSNVLAVHALNAGVNSNDLLMRFKLDAEALPIAVPSANEIGRAHV